MYRSSWATSLGQEAILALRISREFFDRILSRAVPSTHSHDSSDTREDWQSMLASSDVRLQWDPDHDPTGSKLDRRAIQVGLRGKALRAFATEELLEVIDMTPFVTEQRPNAHRDLWDRLLTPVEHVYLPNDPAVASAIRLDAG